MTCSFLLTLFHTQDKRRSVFVIPQILFFCGSLDLQTYLSNSSESIFPAGTLHAVTQKTGCLVIFFSYCSAQLLHILASGSHRR